MARRIQRINSLIQQEVSDLLQRQVKDPRLSTFITVTEVSTTPDLKYAKIFVSRLGSEEGKRETLSVLAAASPFFRRELAKRLDLPRVPEISFHWDDSIERGDRILRLLDEVNKEGTP
jgi:ribosome-binding factor A